MKLITNLPNDEQVRGWVRSMTWMIAILLYIVVLSDTTKENVSLINSIFAAFAAMTSISFSWARSLSPEHPFRGRILKTAEDLLHVTIYLAYCIVLKYGSYAVMRFGELHQNLSTPLHIVRVLLSICYGLLTGYLLAISQPAIERLVSFRKLMRDHEQQSAIAAPSLTTPASSEASDLAVPLSHDNPEHGSTNSGPI